MKILAVPDSYKGCLSSVGVAEAMLRGIRKADEGIAVEAIPFADGGEGTVEAMVSGAGGMIVKNRVTGPLGEQIDSFYGILDDNRTAVIEMAAASGLSLVPVGSMNPMETTTYGTGELIIAALDAGCNRLIIGVGGSATNDGGTGMAQALGIVFRDENGNELGKGGKILSLIHSFDISGLDKRIQDTEITVACDVDNPFFGEKGAAFVYGPQKGADEDMVRKLDKGLANLASVIMESTGMDIDGIPGAGAAGGLAGGLVAFTGARLEKGIDIVSKVCRLEERISEADLVITGEGRTDYQTAFGKVPAGVAEAAKISGTPVICISGSLGDDYEELFNKGITAAFSISPGPGTLEESIENAPEYIENATRSVIATWLSGK